MIFKPAPLGFARLDPNALAEDKKNCKKIGPCGLGEKAIYLNSFYIDRRYYLPYSSITRVFKRVAMSKGGFSGKGMFASIPYLVVEYDGGKQKQCNFKYEEQVDQILAELEKTRPQIKRVSAAAEERLAKRDAELAAQRKPELSPQARKNVEELQRAAEYLEKRPELSLELSQSASRKRAYLRSSPSYRWVAMAITVLGAVALVYGIWSLVHKGSFAIYFTLFGLAAIFLFSGFSVLPTSRNNKTSVMKRADRAVEAMERYLADYSDFPLPARYAHPVVLRRMQRAIEQGRAVWPAEALEVVKNDLKALNADVQVSQEEYDEVVAIKPMFLNAEYR